MVPPGDLPFFGSGHDWAFDAVTTLHLSSAVTVPEPTTMALFGLGATGMGCIVRRRRNRAA
jgi:hypothetical protein